MNLSTCVLLSLQGAGQCRRKMTKLYRLVPLQSPGFQPELGFQNYFIILLFVPRQFPFSFSTLLNSLLTTYSYPSFSALNLASLSLSLFFFHREVGGHRLAFPSLHLCQNPTITFQRLFSLAPMASCRILLYQLLCLSSLFFIFLLTANMLLQPSYKTNNNR